MIWNYLPINEECQWSVMAVLFHVSFLMKPDGEFASLGEFVCISGYCLKTECQI